jgi:hypothetical protein
MLDDLLASSRDADLRRELAARRHRRLARHGPRQRRPVGVTLRRAVGYRLVLLGWRLLDGAGHGWRAPGLTRG